jgi:hypothetical protein
MQISLYLKEVELISHPWVLAGPSDPSKGPHSKAETWVILWLGPADTTQLSDKGWPAGDIMHFLIWQDKKGLHLLGVSLPQLHNPQPRESIKPKFGSILQITVNTLKIVKVMKIRKDWETTGPEKLGEVWGPGAAWRLDQILEQEEDTVEKWPNWNKLWGTAMWQ